MINRFLLIFALVTFFCCQKEDFQNNLAETILGNWNIEKGGNFIFEKDSLPLPLSPVMSTVMSVGATCAAT